MKEAKYYKVEGDRVVCTLCPHGCRLREGQTGRCRSRLAHDGKLYSLVYGRPCALAIDPIEKKPLLHFHPGTECLSLACTGCNLRCLNCQNSDISQVSPDQVQSAECLPEQVVDIALKHHMPTIAYTYTEPLTYLEYIVDTARLAHEQGLYNVLVSAGYVNQGPLADLLPYLDAANIDLKSFSDDIYRRVNGATLQPVLDTLLTLKARGVHLEITNLLIPGVNTQPELITSMCQWLVDNGFQDTPLHFSRFFPRYRMQDSYPTPLSDLRQARDIARAAGIRMVHLGNV